ncbi:TPA: serine protein kinase RIO, partial [archaeon]|nr:serine protein kinase RIO [Candidatus Naiadarchaeales archaeon SRR2090153.bin1042]
MVKKHERRRPLEYERKIEEGVFDAQTLGALRKLMKLNMLDAMGGPIAMGKEANVFTAFLKGEPRAVKIFRIETTSFKDIMPYIEGDPRFRFGGRRHEIVFEWAKKEFRNLERAYHAGVKVPKPHKVLRNILIMDFIGNGSEPAFSLNRIPTEEIKNPKKLHDKLLGYLKNLYKKAGLVHADFSEFNVLMKSEAEPYLIDFAQAVLKTQPNAQMFLEKDAGNFTRYFGKLGIKVDAQK